MSAASPESRDLRCGLVLCGGLSSRMGIDKASLPFGPEPLLARVVRLVAPAVARVVVVAASEQRLPELPRGVEIVRDGSPGRGPLEGLRSGLASLPDDAAVYTTPCDAPWAVRPLIEFLFAAVEGHDIAAPRVGENARPLPAVYRAAVLPTVETLLAADQRRLGLLLERARTRHVEEAELRTVDPRLDALRNVNCREEYLAALAAEGIVADANALARLGLPASGGTTDMRSSA